MSGFGKKRRKISVKPQGGLNSDINITPMVDVVLVLLIIFMVVAPLLVKQFHLLLPPQEKSEAPPPQNPGRGALVTGPLLLASHRPAAPAVPPAETKPETSPGDRLDPNGTSA